MSAPKLNTQVFQLYDDKSQALAGFGRPKPFAPNNWRAPRPYRDAVIGLADSIDRALK